MKFALKGFFSIFLLVAVTGWSAKTYADCGSGSCATNSNSSCGCTNLSCTDALNEGIAPLCSGGNTYGMTFYDHRSAGDNSARKQMYTDSIIHRYGSECFYGVGFLAVEYQQSFRNQCLAKWFGSTESGVMSYGVIDSSANNYDFDLNSLQFGVTGSGNLSFCPKIQDVVVDLNLYFGLDEFFCGLWARLDIPMNWEKRSIGLVEDTNPGGQSTTYPTNLYGVGASIPNPFVNDTFPMSASLRGDQAWGDGLGAVPVLKYGKICNNRSGKFNVAGIRLDLGYDWFRRECWHFATSLDLVVPVGSSVAADYLFDAMVGDAKRTQIGGTVNFAYELWSNCDGSKNVGFYLDLTANALLKRNGQRLIGLNQVTNSSTLESRPNANAWSQYLVLMKFNSSAQLEGLERAANILAPELKVGAQAIVDLSMMLQWNCKCWYAGLGYEFWMRTREIAKCSSLVVSPNTYVVKGVQPVTANAADPLATINSVSASGITINSSNIAQYALPQDADNSVYDYVRALHPKSYSNKVFGYAGYNWSDCDWQPFVLVGAEAEFGNNNRAISQWGVLGKAGISF